MTCVLEFQELANRNPFVKDLIDQGYHADFVGGYFVIYGVPYLDEARTLQYGDWVSQLDIGSEGRIDPPSNHQAWFNGSRPHNNAGGVLNLGAAVQKVQVSDILAANYS